MSCTWYLVTYLLGWALASAGVGVLILSYQETMLDGNLLVFLLVGFLVLLLGCALIILSVALPYRCAERVDILKRHEGTYIRFSPAAANGHHQAKLNFPRDDLVTSSQLLHQQYLLDSSGSFGDSSLLSVPWSGGQGGQGGTQGARPYNGKLYTEENRLSFYRETPV